MPQDSLVVFDIETIPDSDHYEGDGFPKPPFHIPVSSPIQWVRDALRGHHAASHVGLWRKFLGKSPSMDVPSRKASQMGNVG